MIFGTPNSTFLENHMNKLNFGSTGLSSSTSSMEAPTTSSSSSSSSSGHTVLFDIGWEVAKKVGGIYTVLKSKAPVTVDEYKSRYALIGPYNPETAATEFEPLIPGPLSSPVIDNMMKKYGIHVHFGKWLVEGYPKVFLIDLQSSMHKLGEWRWDLMSGFEQPGDTEANESIVFGYQSALLLKEFAESNPNDKYLAHFHEWQSSIGLILLKKWKIPIATIFTTHATLLGRYLSAGGVDLYNQMQYLNMDYEASKRGIYHRHWIEKKSASDANVFTTVSEITAFESETILSRKADVILPNGLKLDQFTALHEFQNLHAKYKNVLHEFVRGHFYGHFDFELDNTIYVFTAGRSEYFNKGVDMFLDALANLNKLLQQSGSTMTIVAFIIMPSKTNNFNVESLKGQSYLKDMRRTCNSIVESMGDRIFEATSHGRIISSDELLKQEDLVMLKRRIFALKQRPSLPPIVTHNMVDDVNDPILNHLRKIKLFNSQEDRVKIIYHPEFLNSTNPLIPLDYTEFVRGCHLGVFVSYYEPWGYTPAECTVLGVPSITSNLTGFANFMKRGLADPESKGIYIVDRRFKSPQESVDQVTEYLWKFCQLDRRQRIELRNRTEKLSELLDWKTLGKFYSTARALALERAFPPAPTTNVRSPSPIPRPSSLSTPSPLSTSSSSISKPPVVLVSNNSIGTNSTVEATKEPLSTLPSQSAFTSLLSSSLSNKTTTTAVTSNSIDNSEKPTTISISEALNSPSTTTTKKTGAFVIPSAPTPAPSPTTQFAPLNSGSGSGNGNTVSKPPVYPNQNIPSPTKINETLSNLSNLGVGSASNSGTVVGSAPNTLANKNVGSIVIEKISPKNNNSTATSPATTTTNNNNNNNNTNSPTTKSIPIPSSKFLK
ncbi:hypothetical protein CYY_004787 [Polysphondylium violaceum]|uniref:Glycogen [starch] synthase n=1 Tax=Polysphondylium violaceum TaxID=133409 RepID=A0A8J4PXI5_9MYCE|nr:hypothetical protein CYY_004787 [Polysphondylium violaceum]